MVVVELVDPVTPELPLVEPGPPIELAPPVEPGDVLPLPIALPPAAPPLLLVLPDVPLWLSLLGAGVDVDGVDGDEGVVGVWSRLVHAPSETAATSASAAHEVRDAFIRNSFRWFESTKGGQTTALRAL